MRILLLEDNEELRGFLALSLTEAGLDVISAADCADALRRLESDKFDGIVLDSVMADSDGIALTQQIRTLKSGRHVPILLMSTISTALARRMAQSVGCSEFLVKPFGQMQFVEQVRNLKPQ